MSETHKRGAQFVLLLACIALQVNGYPIRRKLEPWRLDVTPPQADGNSERRQLRGSDEGTPLRLLHINDIHAQLDSTTVHFTPCDDDDVDSCFGGFARLQTAAAAARAAAPGDSLLLHAGDQFFGTLFDVAYTSRGDQIHHLFLNKLGVDAFVPGSHEFDYGADILAMFLDVLDAPALACNVETVYPWLRPLLRRFAVFQLPQSGIKVGIVGFVPPTTAVISNPGPGVQFKDPGSVAAGCVAGARAAGAEVIIALTHLGYDADLDLAVGGMFDAVIGGGSHSFLHNNPVPPLIADPRLEETADVEGPYPTLVKARNRNQRVIVATGYWGGRYLGQLDTKILPNGQGLAMVQETSRPVLLGGRDSTSPVASDPDVLKAIDELRGRVQQLADRVVGTSIVPLDGESEVRARETRLGNMITDAMLWYVQTHTSILDKYPTVPVAVILNGGAIRASLPIGQITAADVSAALPFGNTIVIKNSTAAVLRGSLANGVSKVPKDYASGRFPQVGSTLQFSFLTTIPDNDDQINAVHVRTADGHRVYDLNSLTLTAPGTPVFIITSSFLGLRGGDGYTMLPPEPTVLDTSVPLDEAVAEYISEKRVVNPKIQKRIQNCGETPTAPLCLRMRYILRSPPPPPVEEPPYFLFRRPPPPPAGANQYQPGSPSRYRQQEEALSGFRTLFSSPPPPPSPPRWEVAEEKLGEAMPPPPVGRRPPPPPQSRATVILDQWVPSPPPPPPAPLGTRSPPPPLQRELARTSG